LPKVLPIDSPSSSSIPVSVDSPPSSPTISDLLTSHHSLSFDLIKSDIFTSFLFLVKDHLDNIQKNVVVSSYESIDLNSHGKYDEKIEFRSSLEKLLKNKLEEIYNLILDNKISVIDPATDKLLHFEKSSSINLNPASFFDLFTMVFFILFILSYLFFFIRILIFILLTT
jgi:hypothetical protein